MSGTLREWLEEAPFTLALSSSFFGFYAHCGFADALYSAGHRPAKFTGASAGAIVAAALASDVTPADAREIFFSLKREDFWDPGPGLGLLRGKKFENNIKDRFARDICETKFPLEISVFDLWTMRTRYLTEGPLAKAVVASCSVPLMFHPVRMGKRIYLDGGILNKSGIHPGHERVLCVYLQSDGVHGMYERKVSFPPLHEGHKILHFKNFPRVDYRSLRGGTDAYQNIFLRTGKALSLPAQGNFLEV